MRKILKIFSENKDLIIVFFASFLLSVQYFVEICKGYLSYVKFDLEYFLLWDYSFTKHLLPFKDLIYPYGLLQYFRGENILMLLIYFVIPSISLTIIYFVLKKIIAQKYYLFVAIVSLYIFILKLTGFNMFGRYGLFISLSFLFAYLIFVKISKLKLFLMGLVMGLFFSVISDQGTYLLTAVCIFYFSYSFAREKVSKFLSASFYLKLLKNFLVLISGFLIGVLPFIIYLYSKNMIPEFLNFLYDLNKIIIVSKGPFFNYITSPDNLFTLLILFVALFFLTIKYIFFKIKIGVFFYLALVLVIDILVLEQKSMIRSIDTTITFVPYVLLILLLYEVLDLLKIFYKENVRKSFFVVLLLLPIFALGLRPSYHVKFSLTDIYNSFNLYMSNRCYDNNLRTFLRSNSEYTEIAAFIQRENLPKKMFSFPPGDSVPYILSNQIPPYYNSAYSDVSLDDQLGDIQYMKNQNIQFVQLDLVNVDNNQDGVPSYIRHVMEFKYILNNFYPSKLIDNHLILIKDQTRDFFNSPLLDKSNSYRNYLLNVNLGMIPFSEGLYKYRYLANKPLIKTDSVDVLNNFLKENKTNSLNKVLVLIPSKELKTTYQNYLDLKTNDGKKTVIHFNACKENKPCIINLSNVPLFYKDRRIVSIGVDGQFKGNIEIYNSDSKFLW